MVKLGKVESNLMIDMKASNAKLCDRAVRIVTDLTGTDDETARAALEATHWEIGAARARLRRRARRGSPVSSAGRP